MRISVDRSRCSSLGMCEAVAPDLLEIGADGELVLLIPSPSEDRRRDVEQAVASCPTMALAVAGATDR